jgi:fatty-acid peroxygenase
VIVDTIPSIGFDSTTGFLADGYTFGTKRCRRLGTDAFRTRLGGRPVVVMLGAEASRLFWSGGRFDRHGSIPSTATHLLQDDGSSQTLEGAEHAQRKGMFLEVLREDERERRVRLFQTQLDSAAERWERQRRVVMHDELQSVLARTALQWVGPDLDEADVHSRTFELSAMVENAGRFGPRNWMARTLRLRTELWARDVIDPVRAGTLTVHADSPVATLAAQTNLDGTPLQRDVAGVDLLNLIRPVVAISRFIVFAALCMHQIPRWHARFASGDESDLAHFVTEVRRHAPFFPVMGGRARMSFAWRGHWFTTGDWVLIDLYGTNHDPRSWEHPNRFRPERFRDWAGDPYTLIPQGGGDYLDDHRCAGEPVTIDIMRAAVLALAQRIRYEVPEQDLRVSLRRFPAGPASGFVIDAVQHTAAA